MLSSFREHLKIILSFLILFMLIGLVLSEVFQPEPSVPEADIRIDSGRSYKTISNITG